MATIYSISNPIDNNVIYIGKTYQNLNDRLNRHLQNKKSPICDWKLKNNITPIIEEIEICDQLDSIRLEEFWIRQFKSWGFILLNKNGFLPVKHKIPREYLKKIKPNKYYKPLIFKLCIATCGNCNLDFTFKFSNKRIRTTCLSCSIKLSHTSDYRKSLSESKHKPVIIYNEVDIFTFISIEDCAKHLNRNQCSVSNALIKNTLCAGFNVELL